MILYHQYDSETGKYVGSSQSQLDPIEKRQLTPNHSTLESLPIHDRYQWPYWDKKINKWVLKDSDFEVKRKLNLKNENGISLYKKVGDFATEKNAEEIEASTKKRQSGIIKEQAESLKNQLRTDTYEDLLKKAMSPKQLEYLAELEKIIKEEIDLTEAVLPTL
jgi:hypothetical protein